MSSLRFISPSSEAVRSMIILYISSDSLGEVIASVVSYIGGLMDH